jgi:endonuclease YncB( thermonuclease family)
MNVFLMKYKTYILLASLIITSSAFALNWKRAKVVRTIDTEHALLADGKVIQLIGFDGPDHIFPTIKERGTARQTYRLLKLIFKTQNIKILEDKIPKINNIHPRHVKLENGKYLTELLLQKGLGYFKSDSINTHFDNKFQKAEIFARKNKIGVWDKPMYQKMNESIRKTAGVMTINWKKKFAHLLAPISIGRVLSVETGNRFTLENGACIHLLGIETPAPFDTRRGHQCFGRQSRDYLAKLILGQTVELTKDISQLDDKRCILRHVWIPQDLNKISPPRHINKEIINNGYGKTFFTEVDTEFKQEFQSIQKEVYKNPRGAWLNCATEALIPKPKEKRIVDKNCPVKVSKSGKIHTPKSGWYSRLKNVRCFQSTEKAIAAGFKTKN